VAVFETARRVFRQSTGNYGRKPRVDEESSDSADRLLVDNFVDDRGDVLPGKGFSPVINS